MKRSTARIIVPLVLCCLAGALLRGGPLGEAAAQPRARAAAPDDSYLGPVRCYIHATDESLVERLKAMQLCRGARSDAPARCFEAATDRVGISDLAAVRLCAVATSMAPASCAERLESRTSLDAATIVSYCAAQRGWLVAPPGPGAPECLDAVLDRTTLSELQAARLCRGSSSAAPLACFELGDDRTFLSDNDLIDLCARVVEYLAPTW